MLEGELRGLKSSEELRFHLLNESRRVIAFRQAFYVDVCKNAELIGVSSVAVVEKNAPLVRWINAIVSELAADQGLQTAVSFDLPAYGDSDPQVAAKYPFPHMLWQPLTDRQGKVFAGVLFAKERAWKRSESDIASYLIGVYSHAMRAFVKSPARRRLPKTQSLIGSIFLAFLLVSAFVEVPMTTMAPAEIIAKDPFIVAAPLSGAIEQILVPPNSLVEAGTALVKFHDTDLRNRYEIAKRELAVAQANDKKTQQNALIDLTGRRDIAVTKTEILLKQAERDYAHEMLEQTTVYAERDGMVVYEDPGSWAGRPVKVGERILEVVDTAKLKVRIELPIDDSISLQTGADARIFLDADPLNWLDAEVTYAGVHAKPTPAGKLAYIVEAEFARSSLAARIGYRGTAQLFGAQVPLYLFLFRRPLSTLRQMFGI